MSPTVLPLMNSELASIQGKTQPRIWTQPLRELTDETSYGFKVIRFAEKVLKQPLDPWQQWLVIHIGELLEDNTPRFTRVLILVARQNGKTHLLKVLALYWQFIERHKLILGMNSNLTDAKEAMLEAAGDAQDNPFLAPLVGRVLEGNNDIKLVSTEGSAYKAVAATEKGGRGKRINRLIVDELRLHKDWKAYNAAVPAMGAQSNAQAVFITNQGDDRSVVLDSLRASAVEYIDSGTGDESLGLFEWSAPDGSNINDPQAWAWANPSLNVRLPYRTLRSAALLAGNGGVEETGFRTEHLCMKVSALDPAIDPTKWAECYDETLTLAESPAPALSYFFDVSLNQTHATLVAARVIDGKTRLELVHEWRDKTVRNATADLKRLIAKHSIKALGYFPIGPAAAFATNLKTLKVPGCKVQEVTSEVAEACEGFAADVLGGRISHQSNDRNNQILTSQVVATSKTYTADRWKFSRKGGGNCDATYALAGAWLLANTQPPRLDYTIQTFEPRERS